MTVAVLDTPIGPVAVTADADGISGVLFENARAEGDADEGVRRAVGALREYFAGASAVSAFEPGWQRCSAFQRKVLEACSRIPCGRTATYAQLAAEIGQPKAVRAVGHALRSNPWPLLIPCHRVIRSDGQLGAYAGVPDSPAKRWLLDHESALTDA